MNKDIFAAFAHDPTFDGPKQNLAAEAFRDATPPTPVCDDGESTLEHGQITDPITARKFILAGKATLTLKSVKTGTRFTYRVSAGGSETDDGTRFVGLLNGPDNESNYAYLGRITNRGIFWPGRKAPRPSDVSPDAASSRAFGWAWRQLLTGKLPDTLQIWHEGRCGRCGRKLTVPESISHGFGPECYGKVGF